MVLFVFRLERIARGRRSETVSLRGASTRSFGPGLVGRLFFAYLRQIWTPHSMDADPIPRNWVVCQIKDFTRIYATRGFCPGV